MDRAVRVAMHIQVPGHAAKQTVHVCESWPVALGWAARTVAVFRADHDVEVYDVTLTEVEDA